MVLSVAMRSLIKYITCCCTTFSAVRRFTRWTPDQTRIICEYFRKEIKGDIALPGECILTQICYLYAIYYMLFIYVI
jgi:hypothetical protein